MPTSHKGECFCGAVHVEVSGEPEAMGYLPLSIMPILVGRPQSTRFTLWKPDAVRVTAGAEHVANVPKKQRSVSGNTAGNAVAT